MERQLFNAQSSHQGQRLPIPRFEQRPPPPPPPPPKASDRSREDRVSRACKTCRKRKVRCSGDVPRCTNCQLNSLECVYEQARRDRLKEATHLNHRLAALLRDLTDHVDDADKRRIEDALDDAEDDLISQNTNPSFTSLGKHGRSASADDDDQATISPVTGHGEAYVTASAGSNEDLDNLDEDLLRDSRSRATGYVGQNSEVQWLRSVQRQTEHPGVEPRGQPRGPPGSGRHAVSARSDALHERRDTDRANSRQGSMQHTTDSSFYLDSGTLDPDMIIDPHEDPSPDVAERLFTCYLETVHTSFPLVPQVFEAEFRKYVSTLRKGGTFKASRRWRAQMNLLLAVGAKYSHLIGAEWKGHDRDHILYMRRATHLLEMEDTAMLISIPDLRLIQATGALSFYYLIIGHVSKAWIMIGISIRFALALGLHLRNEDPKALASTKEILVNTWWNLHSIECLVSAITGRPPVLAVQDCTVPLPHSVPEEGSASTNTSRDTARRRIEHHTPGTTRSSNITEGSQNLQRQNLHLSRRVRIALTSQKALFELYSPRTATRSWQFVQEKISALLNELEEWASQALPEGPHMGKGKQKGAFQRDQFLLKTEYWSTKILVTRPCLCRIERRIRDESDKSADFNTKSAETCVEAALEMTKLFPDQPDLGFLYTQGPWWAIVHLIMQAVAVLLLEMSYNNKDMRGSDPSMTVSIKKLIRWLRAMQYNDPVAVKAYQVIDKIFKSCAPALQSQFNDLRMLEEDVEMHMHIHQGPHGAFGMQPTAQTSQPNFSPHLQDSSATFDMQTFLSQLYNPIPGIGDDIDPLFPPNQHIPQMSFGNPFFTPFDQGAPIVNMQEMWANPAASNIIDPNLSNMDISPVEYEGQQKPNMGFPPQQQQFPYQDSRE